MGTGVRAWVGVWASSVLSCKFVEKTNLPKLAAGKAKNAVIPSGIARLFNAACCQFSEDLFNEFVIQDTRNPSIPVKTGRCLVSSQRDPVGDYGQRAVPAK